MPHVVRTTLKVVLAVIAAFITHVLILYLVRPEADHLQLHLAYTHALGLGRWIGNLVDPLYVDGDHSVWYEDEKVPWFHDGFIVDRTVTHLFWLFVFSAVYLSLLLRRRKRSNQSLEPTAGRPDAHI